MMSLQIIPIHLKNDIQPKDDLTDQLLSSSKTRLENGDVLVISQKVDRKSTRLNSSHSQQSRMPSSA